MINNNSNEYGTLNVKNGGNNNDINTNSLDGLSLNSGEISLNGGDPSARYANFTALMHNLNQDIFKDSWDTFFGLDVSY